MIRPPQSLRWRLQLWYGLLLVAVLLGFGATAFHFETSRQLRATDAALQVRLAAVVEALRAIPGGGPDKRENPSPRFTAAQAALFDDADGHYFVIWMRSETPLLASRKAPSGIPRPAKGDSLPRMRGGFREAFLFAAPVDCILVGRSMEADSRESRRLAYLLTGAGGLILVAGLLTGWWLTARAIKPIEEISATAERIAAGDLSQRIPLTHPDSELGRLASVLNSTFERLAEAFAQQARFTADAAHELRTPIAVMLTQAQSALARERDAGDYKEALEACQRAAQRMRRLTESLLALARLDAGQEKLALTPCDLAIIATGAIQDIQPLATARSIEVQTLLAASPVLADPDMLSQVFTNLLANAVEYNHDGGRITVSTECAGSHARFTISNTGNGISSEALPHVFERFYRADTSRSSGHSGLGLAICQTIITAHGGTIEARREPLGETTLQVSLPNTGNERGDAPAAEPKLIP